MDVKIFVCYHKKTPLIKNDVLTPVWVCGTAPFDCLTNNTGTNIADKNDSFCELTVHYWAWKNIKADFCGIFHYRRFLNFSGKEFPSSFHFFTPKLYKKYGLDPKTITDICRNNDVILPCKSSTSVKCPLSLYDYYKQKHNIRDLDVALTVLSERHPDMIETAKEVLNGKTGYFANLFLMRDTYFHDYEKWLFDILFEVEKRIDISSYDSYQRRVFGFLSERLQSIYIEHLKRHTNARIIELPPVFWESDIKANLKRQIKFYKRRLLRLIGIRNVKNRHHG